MLKEQPQFPCLFVLHRLWTWMIIARPLTSSTLMEVVTGQSAHKFGIWESDIIRLCKFVIPLAPTSHTQFPFLNPHRSQTSTIHPKKGRRLTVQLIWEELTGLGFLELKHLMYATLQHYNITTSWVDEGVCRPAALSWWAQSCSSMSLFGCIELFFFFRVSLWRQAHSVLIPISRIV